MTTESLPQALTARINDVEIVAATPADLRHAAVQELLRQRAVTLGLLAADADEAATAAALEQLLEREVPVPQAGDEEIERHYLANPGRYTAGELVFASHILLQVTERTPIQPLLARAEAILHQVQADASRFAELAQDMSNCPSAQVGGSLGQLQRGDTVPEFEAALFADGSVGVLPRVVRTRYGFHIVKVERREPGRLLPLAMIRDRVASDLAEQSLSRALRQYLERLAANAEMDGMDLIPDRRH
ncbi:peptidylprolyl isomerase [Pseudogulbenkiania sp. MAI-1]|uniref:peptidylprolyl isomerase n=1 Tax=Pseudogulbenkiania sp. MAI-1 TaxID=990370 RepID=UPI00045EC5F8|nr:peptidylprolyl isomerase [Pseudogulbenkiania sp. MAI-1]